MLADFTITVEEARKPLAVQVKIHDSVAALRAASTRYDRVTDKNSKAVTDLLGVCHRFHMADNPVCAIVRLAPPNIGAGIVAHEMGHAAVWLWEVHNMWKKPLCNLNDEWFCWTLGELVRQTTIQLIERDIY